jgi:hypothetical protein
VSLQNEWDGVGFGGGAMPRKPKPTFRHSRERTLAAMTLALAHEALLAVNLGIPVVPVRPLADATLLNALALGDSVVVAVPLLKLGIVLLPSVIILANVLRSQFKTKTVRM